MSANHEAAGLAAYVIATSLLDYLVSAGRIEPKEQDDILKEALAHLEALRPPEASDEAFARATFFIQARLNASMAPRS